MGKLSLESYIPLRRSDLDMSLVSKFITHDSNDILVFLFDIFECYYPLIGLRKGSHLLMLMW